jgi:hypothetical protein
MCNRLPLQNMAQVQATGILESTTRPFEGKMGWLPWNSSTSHSPPTGLPGEPANLQGSAPPQNASSAASPNRVSSSPPNPLRPIKDGPVSEGNYPRLRRVFTEFMNGQAAPLVRPLAASPWVQNTKKPRISLITFLSRDCADWIEWIYSWPAYGIASLST